MGRECGMYGGEKKRMQGLTGKLAGKRPLGTPRHRWEDNIKVDIKETEWAGMDYFNLVQDSDKSQAVVCTVMDLWI
jgi:hypothetical protein